MRALDPVVDFFRGGLTPGRPVAELVDEFRDAFPAFAGLLRAAPPKELLEATNLLLGVIWDGLYVQTTLGCDRFVSTNHLVDALRVYHVLALLWLSGKHDLEAWGGGGFDEYHPLIDLEAALEDDTPTARRASRKAVASLAGAFGSSFRVPLSVGEMKPPTIGDLILVKQELRRYEDGALASIETVMRGERREHSLRTLSRTTQTTTTETSTESEETSSVSTDERFRLASEAQATAAQSFGVDVGVSVSGKFGPVQVAATANASYDTSKSTTDTHLAGVRQDRHRGGHPARLELDQGVELDHDPQRVAGHPAARIRQHGRHHPRQRDVPLARRDPRRDAAQLRAPPDAVARPARAGPVLPRAARAERGGGDRRARRAACIRRDWTRTAWTRWRTGSPAASRASRTSTPTTYARLAALYDVTGIAPPIPQSLTGSKVISVPEGTPPAEVKDDGLSYVTSDNTLVIDPDYRITKYGVYAPEGAANFRRWASTMHLGEKKNETDTILVWVGDHEFFFTATGNGDNDPKTIDSNFNSIVALHDEFEPFGSEVRPALPIAISASFSGLLSLTVIYEATRRDEALDRWKAATYAAIIKGYLAKRQAYDQALALTQAKVASDTVAQTFQLREDQYRAIELTELKRGCIELMSEGTAHGRTSISVAEDGTPTIVFDEAEGGPNWRSPLANGTVADWFEQALDWKQTVYTFYPYYWAAEKRWAETAQATGADPIFEGFLQAGSANVVVPVLPGFERSMILFLNTGHIWGGRYMPLFSTPEMLEVYAEAELGTQLDPPEQIGEPWEIRLPTSLVMLQADDTLPEFPPAGPEAPPAPLPEPTSREPAPF